LEALRRLTGVWAEVKDAISDLDRVTMLRLESDLWDWMYPSHAARGTEISPEVEREMPAFALRVLQDLVPLAKNSPAVQARLSRLAARLGVTLPVERDPLFEVFELLYPEDFGGTEPEGKAARQEALRSLAITWAREGPDGIRHVAWYEAQAERIGYSWPRGSQEVCRVIAQTVDDPRPYLRAVMDCGLGGAFASPFIERTVRERRQGWEVVAERCLDTTMYQFAAIDAILKLPDADPALVARALDRAAAWPQAVETLAMRREMPDANLRAALRHSRWEVALAAAVGEWHASRKSDMRHDFSVDWKRAITGSRADGSQIGTQFWLKVILGTDPDLALEWLRAHLRDQELLVSPLDGPFAAAVEALSREQRVELLRELHPAPTLHSLLPPLVGKDAELYRQLLARPQLRDYHLEPLGGRPDEDWSALAVAALESGHTPERVAAAAISGGSHFYAGPGVDHWQSWAEAFAALEGHARAEMREVGRHGKRTAGEELTKALLRKEQITLRGL
jgi:hypothetical protein